MKGECPAVTYHRNTKNGLQYVHEISWRATHQHRGDVPGADRWIVEANFDIIPPFELWHRGETLHRRCAALLEAAEGRIEELSGPPDDRDAPGL